MFQYLDSDVKLVREISNINKLLIRPAHQLSVQVVGGAGGSLTWRYLNLGLDHHLLQHKYYFNFQIFLTISPGAEGWWSGCGLKES